MKDPRVTPANRKDRPNGMIAYISERLRGLMCELVTMERYYRTDLNVVPSFLCLNRICSIDWNQMAVDTNMDVKDFFRYYNWKTGEVVPVPSTSVRQTVQDSSNRHKVHQDRVFPRCPVIFNDNNTTLEMAEREAQGWLQRHTEKTEA